MALKLIVGLGNPGPDYAQTRHNVGQLFVEHVASNAGIALERTDRFFGMSGRGTVAGADMRLLVPTTYMNRSGQAVAAIAQFYKIEPAEMLIAHDEVAFAPGVVRLKQGGGLNGHNGLRDIVPALGNHDEFLRLRIGVGHPGDKAQMTAYLTGRRMPAEERKLAEQLYERALEVLPLVVRGELSAAMTALHTEPGKPG